MMKFILLALIVSCTLNVVFAGSAGICPQCIFKNAIRGIVDWAATDFSFVNPGAKGWEFDAFNWIFEIILFLTENALLISWENKDSTTSIKPFAAVTSLIVTRMFRKLSFLRFSRDNFALCFNLFPLLYSFFFWGKNQVQHFQQLVAFSQNFLSPLILRQLKKMSKIFLKQ